MYGALLVIAISFLGYRLAKSRLSSPTSEKCLPPSPDAHPIWGHALKLRSNRPWELYASLAKNLGDLIYLRVFAKRLIVICSFAAAQEINERNGGKIAARPRFRLMEHMGWSGIIVALSPGAGFRKQRRILQNEFSPQVVKARSYKREHHLQRFLRSLSYDLDNFQPHIGRFVGRAIASSVYGYDAASDDDKLIQLIEKSAELTLSTGNSNASIVDIFPFLSGILPYLPGENVMKYAMRTRAVVDETTWSLFNQVKARVGSGQQPDCMVADVLSTMEQENQKSNIGDKYEEIDIQRAASATIGAGFDTVKSTITTFFMFMTLNPDVVRRAQTDIDKITEGHHFPTLDDRDSLPFIDCILREVLRCLPPTPLGVPHRATEDVTYQGQTIPEGALVLMNLWNMMHDEAVFPDNSTFRPERHLLHIQRPQQPDSDIDALRSERKNNYIDPSIVVFGIGRRACPGRNFADATLWLTFARILALFDIHPYKDPVTGEEVLPDPQALHTGITVYPMPFRCRLSPRNSSLLQMLQEEDMTGVH